MKRSIVFGLLGIVIVAAASVALAGFQVKKQIGKLSLEGWQLSEREGRLGLDQFDTSKWQASAPTITDMRGRFIAGDPEGKQPTVHLVSQKGPHVNWAFEFTERWRPHSAGLEEGRSNSHLLKGKSGFRFKMQLTEGPFKNWYAAVDDLPAEANKDLSKVPAWRPLKLVQDPRAAALFDYVGTYYDVGHK